MEQNQNNLQKAGLNPPKKIYPINSLKNSNRFTDNKTSRIKNDMFDDAVKELLDMCQQYDAELSSKPLHGNQTLSLKNNNNNKSIANNEHSAQDGNILSKKLCDNEQQATTKFSTNSLVTSQHSTDSIEELQKKQSYLQSQLDEALNDAKELELRHQRKLSSNRKEQDDLETNIDGAHHTTNSSYTSDEEDELVEFQKIENELRISELNRQLESINISHSGTYSYTSTRDDIDTPNQSSNLSFEQKLYEEYSTIQENDEDAQKYYQSLQMAQAYYEHLDSGLVGNNRLVEQARNNVIRKRRTATNRPLTLYLPKPNEDIDLVEHIQALGHDLDIISGDLKLSTFSAQGYLWKRCSNNNKKWLKRYFYFDRSQKVLSYYEYEANLVKSSSSPKCRIPFEEINDVYVDHKLSGLGEKDRSSKRHYVFVLSTDQRKYLLASSRAETMRAWIDILFTSSKANSYFHEEDRNEEEDYDELVGGLAVTEI